MQQLVLLRGLPGSGKSTIANLMTNFGFKHFEADMFFIDQDTWEYKFDPKLIPSAHEWCQKATVRALEAGCDAVVSNTFTQQWEMKFYKDYANEHGIRIVELVAKGNFPNVHGVPAESLQRMRDRWED